MKKISSFIILAVIVLVGFTACGKSGDNPVGDAINYIITVQLTNVTVTDNPTMYNKVTAFEEYEQYDTWAGEAKGNTTVLSLSVQGGKSVYIQALVNIDGSPVVDGSEYTAGDVTTWYSASPINGAQTIVINLGHDLAVFVRDRTVNKTITKNYYLQLTNNDSSQTTQDLLGNASEYVDTVVADVPCNFSGYQITVYKDLNDSATLDGGDLQYTDPNASRMLNQYTSVSYEFN